MRSLERVVKRSFISLYKLLVVPELIKPEELPPANVKKILVILRHQMGDMLTALPMLYSLREHYPTQFITLLTKSSSNYQLLFSGGSSPVSEVIKFEYGFEKLLQTIKAIEYENYEIAIVPSTTAFSSSNHIIPYLSKIKYRVGTGSFNGDENPYAKFLNVRSSFEWKRIHQIERNLDIIRQMGIDPVHKHIHIELNETETEFAENFYNEKFPDKKRPVIAFHPGAGKAGNVWPPERFAELAFMLKEKYDPYILISQGPNDDQWVSQLTGLLNGIDFAVHFGVLIKDIAVISKAYLLVSNDTGVMHIASGLKTPVIGLFGLTKAYEWGPMGTYKYSIQSKNGMMEGISAESVYGLCTEILEMIAKYKEKG